MPSSAVSVEAAPVISADQRIKNNKIADQAENKNRSTDHKHSRFCQLMLSYLILTLVWG